MAKPSNFSGKLSRQMFESDGKVLDAEVRRDRLASLPDTGSKGCHDSVCEKVRIEA